MRLTMPLAASLLAGLVAGTLARAQTLPEGLEEPALPAPVPTVEAPLGAQRDAADGRYRELMAQGRNAEAVAAGEDVVALTRQLHGDGSPELASALTNLATAQLRNGDLRDAETNYQAAIELLEKSAGFLSLRLVNPLVGLGEAYNRDEQYALATEAYERALHINHVNEGFYNLDQMTIRDGLAEGYLGLQDLEQANLHQSAQVYARQKRLGTDDPEVVGALTKLGGWYERTGQPEQARLAYQNALRLVEQADGKDAPSLVDLLVHVADTYRQQALLPPDPEANQSPSSLLALSSMTLRRAQEVIDKREPPDPAQRARLLVQLGDLYQLWGKRSTAASRYREAWQELSSDPGLEALRSQYFAEPTRIIGPAAPTIYPPPARNAPPPSRQDLEPGFVVVRFDVDASGRVVDPTVIEADPANLLEKWVTEAAASAVYRPRYADAEPVPATGLILRHEFRYAPAKLDAQAPAPPDEADKPLDQPLSGAGS